MARSGRSKRQSAKDLKEVLKVKRAKRALSNGDYKADAQVPKREAPPVPTLVKEDQLKEAHELLLEIKQAQLDAMTPFQVLTSSLGSLTEIGNFLVQADLSVLASIFVDSMGEPSVPVSEIEKMVKKIVAANLEKLLGSNKGKEQVIIEDDEAESESERKEHMDDTWQDKELFAKKMPTKKTEPKPVVLKKFEKLDKKLEKLHVFMKSKEMDQYVDIDDDDDNEIFPVSVPVRPGFGSHRFRLRFRAGSNRWFRFPEP
ncbi:hypothetical protein JCGZ_19294 [Jatropha curcas]|uniref:Uncharacterized protein n=1 Tax=Jatropha curcas TaxID=180498 RepID=A0A067KB22_JATCU|nr:hypothetical protein JCGZ_19294 [Jatropha curcas]